MSNAPREDAPGLYAHIAAAYVRGAAIYGKPPTLPGDLAYKPLDALTDGETLAILQAGADAGLKLYRFKRTQALPRVKRVLGYLKGQDFASLLDVGSGRGVFLWPFLAAFPRADTLSLDILDHRVLFIEQVAAGGIHNLRAMCGDICHCPEIPDKSRDIVTLLEVLEHIPDTAAALASAVRIARKALIVSVPSKPDNNPGHIRLFTKASMTEALNAAGCRRLRFDAAPGHMLVFARMED